MTDSTDRMSSPLRRHTSFPRVKMAPSTMLSPACWPGAQHHSMYLRLPQGHRVWAGLGAPASQQAGGQSC